MNDWKNLNHSISQLFFYVPNISLSSLVIIYEPITKTDYENKSFKLKEDMTSTFSIKGFTVGESYYGKTFSLNHNAGGARIKSTLGGIEGNIILLVDNNTKLIVGVGFVSDEEVSDNDLEFIKKGLENHNNFQFESIENNKYSFSKGKYTCSIYLTDDNTLTIFMSDESYINSLKNSKLDKDDF